MGQKAPGVHMSKSKAARWNGRTEKGESVTSDVYFYFMEAGEFTNLRKMAMAWQTSRLMRPCFSV